MPIATFLLVTLLATADPDFGNPQQVTINGYTGDAMEPFITRDGSILFFNNSNARPDETDLHWAQRIDDLAFQYRGRIEGANSPALDGVATMDAGGNLFFVTVRSYGETLTTIYRGRFDRGVMSDVAPVSGITRGVPGQVNFDVEVSADGATLYFADGLFTGGPVPLTADLAIAVRGADGSFHRQESGALNAINTDALEYAACISADQRELFFTRLTGTDAGIYRSTRPDTSSPWLPPRRLTALTGFVEAPTIAPDGGALYYHALRGGRFVIERVTRTPPLAKRRAVRH